MADRLADQGWAILQRNWHVRGGEIDIVALDGEVLVFVEVRSRLSGAMVNAEDSVSPTKLKRLFGAAARYLQTFPEHEERFWRVDLAALTMTRNGDISDYHYYENLTLD